MSICSSYDSEGNLITAFVFGEEEQTKCEKPPLGVKPKKLFYEARIQDLCRALHAYAPLDRTELMQEWAKELVEILNILGGK